MLASEEGALVLHLELLTLELAGEDLSDYER